MSKIVLSFGEILWDLLPQATILGGAPFNFTYRVNTLGETGLMISRLGRDALGEKAFEAVRSLNLNTDYLQWDNKRPTGTVQVYFDEQKNPDFLIIPGVAYDFVEMNPVLREIAVKADCLCFGTLAQRKKKSRNTLAELIKYSKKSIKFLDINLRKDCFTPETIRFSLEKADILKLNEDEAYQLAKIFGKNIPKLSYFCSETIKKWELKYCLITLGDKGAFAQSHNGEKIYVPGFQVDLVDSLGSGDAFSAGFIHKILNNFSLKEACEFGNILGALVATKAGATPTVSFEEINRFVQEKFVRNHHPEVL
jgi:fructokinase